MKSVILIIYDIVMAHGGSLPLEKQRPIQGEKGKIMLIKLPFS